MRDSIGVLLAHVNKTLPDSLPERCELLHAMVTVMGPDHPALPDVSAHLASYTAIKALQESAQLKFDGVKGSSL